MPTSAWACIPVKTHVHEDVAMALITQRSHYRMNRQECQEDTARRGGAQINSA